MLQGEESVVFIKWTKKTEKNEKDKKRKREDYNNVEYSTGFVAKNSDKEMLIISSFEALRDLYYAKTTDYINREVHTLARNIRVDIEFFDSTKKVGHVMAFNGDADLVLIGVQPTDGMEQFKAVSFGEKNVIKRDHIWSVLNRGFMKQDNSGNMQVDSLLKFCYTKTTVSHPERVLRSRPNIKCVEYFLPLAGYMSSGAPIYNEKGQVVALHSFGLRDEMTGDEVHYGIPASNILHFLKNYRRS